MDVKMNGLRWVILIIAVLAVVISVTTVFNIGGVLVGAVLGGITAAFVMFIFKMVDDKG